MGQTGRSSDEPSIERGEAQEATKVRKIAAIRSFRLNRRLSHNIGEVTSNICRINDIETFDRTRGQQRRKSLLTLLEPKYILPVPAATFFRGGCIARADVRSLQ